MIYKKGKEYFEILKPCPKCGSIHVRVAEIKTFCFTTYFSIECDKCEYKICGKNKRKIVNQWGVRNIENKKSHEYNMCSDSKTAIEILEFIKQEYQKSSNLPGVKKYIDALQMGIDSLKNKS